MYITALFIMLLTFLAVLVCLFAFGWVRGIFISGLNKWALGLGLVMQIFAFLFGLSKTDNSFLIEISFVFLVLGDVFVCAALFFSYVQARFF